MCCVPTRSGTPACKKRSMTRMRRGLLLGLYLLLAHGFPLIAPTLLRKRLKRGKEHPDRWREKLGQSLAPRPDGTLIWFNAVGLGEVMSLRGLITRIAALDPQVQFLVTSTTSASAKVFADNLPPRTIHQFLPIDAPGYRRRFLQHFQPDLCIWAEQDIWPGFVSDLTKLNTPQAVVAARMDAKALQKRQKFAALYRDIYRPMRLITAQDDRTAQHLNQLSGRDVAVTGSLKPAALALSHDPETLSTLETHLASRTVWTVAPSHAEDEAIALAAHALLREKDPTALLIIAPRFPERVDDITTEDRPKFRSKGELPNPRDPIWICDTFGELGLVYRLANLVLIGGTFGDIEGHNPWEAAILGTAIAHGPRIANFADDFAALDMAEAAEQVTNPAALADLLRSERPATLAQNAEDVITTAANRTDDLAQQLIDLLKGADG